MHGTDTLNRASESIARSTRVAVETGKFCTILSSKAGIGLHCTMHTW